MRGQQQPPRIARVKKLARNTGQNVYREDEIDAEEYASLHNQPNKLASGVEANEVRPPGRIAQCSNTYISQETEVHLQAALAAASNGDKEGEIPAPIVDETADIDYDVLYSRVFKPYHSYIRHSETVEDSIGCQYDMTTEDDVFLTNYNKKKSGASRCSEDDFERIMAVFENAANSHAPMRSIDNTVVSFDSMELAVAQKLEGTLHGFAKDFYEHWKSREQRQPSLKIETHPDNDDLDPYVCFRYREVRQTRKTRARDVLSTDKLKKLRRELEDGNSLVTMAHDREVMKRQAVTFERTVFNQRGTLKDQKRKLGITTNDEDLINQKVCISRPSPWSIANVEQPQKRPKTLDFPAQRQLGPVRIPGKIDRVPEADLQLLSDLIEGKENALQREIEEKTLQHRKWNENFVDLTREPLSPVYGQGPEMSFRPATAQYQYLMTPPSSVTSESFDQGTPILEKQETIYLNSLPPDEDEPQGQPAYRRRMGRGGRLWIDRKGMGGSKPSSDDADLDRWKYDEDYEDEQPIYEMSAFSTNALRFRSTIPPRDKRPVGASPSNNRAIAAAPQPQAPT